ncbi:MAG: helix-turn-helix domain-containing protein [Candidatus Thiodiazotropha sp.]
MTKEGIAKLRKRLGLNQTEFGNLFGVHPMTISKWERGTLSPNHYQHALMSEFEEAAKSKQVRETIGAVLVGAGIAAALYLLLKNSRG